jgi:hypothetical protein
VARSHGGRNEIIPGDRLSVTVKGVLAAITGFWRGGRTVGSARLPPKQSGRADVNLPPAQQELRPPEFAKFAKSFDRIRCPAEPKSYLDTVT